MNGHRYYVLALLLFTISFFGIKSHAQNRVIKFYNLYDFENQSYMTSNNELPRLLIGAVRKGLIRIYDVDYQNDCEVKVLDMDKLDKRLILFEEESFDEESSSNVEYFSMRDLHLLGLDIVEDQKGKSEIVYVNLYVPAERTQEYIRRYIGSFRFTDVADLLDEEKLLLYSTDGIWNNEIFTNYQGDYFSDLPKAKMILEQALEGKIKAEFSDVTSLGHRLEEGYLKVQLTEKRKKGFYTTQEMTFSQYDIPSKKQQVLAKIPWKELTKLKGSNPEILFLSQAMSQGKLVAPSEANERKDGAAGKNEATQDQWQIAENGLYTDSGNTFSPPKSQELRKRTLPNLSKTRLSVRYTEEVNLEDSINADLHQKSASLTALVINAIKEYRVSPYVSDSLNQYMVNDQFLENISLPTYDEGEETVYLDIMENFTLIHPIYELTFNSKGEKKKYEFKGLGLFIPFTKTIQGFTKVVCWVDKQGVEEALKGTEALKVLRGNKNVTLMEVLEQRLFSSYFVKSSPIQLPQSN